MELLFVAVAQAEEARGRRRRAVVPRVPRILRDLLDPLAVNDHHLLRYYRFPRNEILQICDELREGLERPTNRSRALPVHTQVLAALRFFASGSFQSVVGDTTGLSQASTSRVVSKVTEILFLKAIRDIRMPVTDRERNAVKHGFYVLANFPHIIGAIDCTHIAIKAPHEDEAVYINRKNYHSLNVQMVCNSQYEITHCLARYPGSSHDSFIYRNSELHNRLIRGDFGESYLLGK